MTDTRSRILAVSLALFNQQGERNVSTNHIAESLGISPGNLYYHFRNKGDIIYQLFQQYRASVENFLTLPQGRALTWQDKMDYLAAILKSMWETRFLHRDLPHLLQQDERLQQEYRAFVDAALARALVVYQGLRSADLLQASDEELRALLINTWVLAASWSSFVHGLVPASLSDEPLAQRLLQQGIYQIVCLEAPYLRNEAARHLGSLRQKFQQGDTIELLFGTRP